MLSYLDATVQEPGMTAEMDQMPSDIGKISVRNYINKFMARQGKLLDATKKSQETTNDSNLRK